MFLKVVQRPPMLALRPSFLSCLFVIILLSRPEKSLQFKGLNPTISLQFIYSPETGLQ